ncbi:hypothetical protein LPJ75_001076 [Coemansia sp. RSA 2598]|nr:hypothetical protein LPJ75_001076 [Coemansia sp. RSA 2598]
MRPSTTQTLAQASQRRYSASPASPDMQRHGDDMAASPSRDTKRPAAPEPHRHKSSSSVSAAITEKVDMLAALASASTIRQSAEQHQHQHQQRVARQYPAAVRHNSRDGSGSSDESHRRKRVRHHDYTLRAYSLSATKQASNAQKTTVVSEKSSIDTGAPQTKASPSANYQSTQLTLDPHTNLPASDIVDELLQHIDLEFNIISKVVHPKAFMAQYGKGRCNTFLLLAVLANNAMYSAHPAIAAMGAVAAAKVFIDRAKLFAPEAFENPSVTGCQALLLLALAYMHQGMLSVSSHYSSTTLKILEQLGVCKLDDDAWSNEEDWISGSSWLDREQIRRLIWGSFSIDTFLSLMMHKSPYVMIDLSGVNRPCAPTMWYVGNDSIESLSIPPSVLTPNPNDTAYIAALKKIKMGGVSWRINGNTVQLNFAMLGNAIMRGISDPHYSKEHLDKLVVCAYKSLSQWVTAAPEMPDNPTFDEVHHTLLLCSAALCLKSVVAPYLITRGRKAADRSTGASETNGNNGGGGSFNLDIRLDVQDPGKTAASSSSPVSEFEYMRSMFDAIGNLNSPSTVDRLLTDYIRTSFQLYRYMRLTANMIENSSTPPMFLAHSTMISGGIFAACAYAAPTQAQRDRFARSRDFIKCMLRDTMRKSLLFRVALDEVERVEEMVQFMPRRLDAALLESVRDTLVPDTIEAVINKRFSQFVEPIRQLARMPLPASSALSPSSLSSAAAQGQQRMQSPPMSTAAAGGSAASDAGVSTGVSAGGSGSGSGSSAVKPQLGLPFSLFGPSRIGSMFCPRMSGSGLSSSLCALFGRSGPSMTNPNGRGGSAISRSATAVSSDMGSDVSDAAFSDRIHSSPPPPPQQQPALQEEHHQHHNQHQQFLASHCAFSTAKPPPDYKLSFTAISSLLVALSIASKDETFFDSMFESMDGLCKMTSPTAATAAAPESDSVSLSASEPPLPPPLSSPPMRPASTLASTSAYLVRGPSDRALYSGPSQTPATTTAWILSSSNATGMRRDSESRDCTRNSRTPTSSLYSSMSPPASQPRFQASKSLSPDMHRATASTSPPAVSSTKHPHSIGDLLN